MAKSRVKTNTKIKEKLPVKIATEKWKRPKQSTGPGFYQKNNVDNVPRKPLEEWEKLPVISWGGSYTYSDDLFDERVCVELRNTCTIDNFFQCLLIYYSLNINQLQRLYDADSFPLDTISQVVQSLLMYNFGEAKYIWLKDICKADIKNNELNGWGTDKNNTFHSIRTLFRRNYDVSTCTSSNCPYGTNEKRDFIDQMTLHKPDLQVDGSKMITQSIKEWESGTSSKAMYSCRREYKVKPTSHDDYFIDNNVDGVNTIRCSGWRNPLNMSFVTKPPFLIFEISDDFRKEINELSFIPHEIVVYGDKYKLGGITSHVASRAHYVGYCGLSDRRLLFYDGSPSGSPPILHINQIKRINGKISLLIYFPYAEFDIEKCDLKPNCADDTKHTEAKCSKSSCEITIDDIGPDLLANDAVTCKAVNPKDNNINHDGKISVSQCNGTSQSKHVKKRINKSKKSPHNGSNAKKGRRSGLRKNPQKKRHSSNWVKGVLEQKSSDDELYFQHMDS